VVAVIGLARVQRLSLARASVAVLGVQLLGVSVALGLCGSVFEVFKVPSPSMLPALAIGDHFFVSKSRYGLLGTSAPALADVIAFDSPDAEPGRALTFVKRVVALPGDTVVVQGGHPIINGKALPACHIGVISLPEPGAAYPADRFLEALGDQRYLIAVNKELSESVQGPYQVLPGQAYVLGDNRGNSFDSRSFHNGQGGGVPFANIKGPGTFIWYPFDRIRKARCNAAPAGLCGRAGSGARTLLAKSVAGGACRPRSLKSEELGATVNNVAQAQPYFIEGGLGVHASERHLHRSAPHITLLDRSSRGSTLRECGRSRQPCGSWLSSLRRATGVAMTTIPQSTGGLHEPRSRSVHPAPPGVESL
jgi:signal peptidase I